MEMLVFEPSDVSFELRLNKLLSTFWGCTIKFWWELELPSTCYCRFWVCRTSALSTSLLMSLHKLDSINRFHGSSAVNLSWIGLVVIYQISIGPRVDWSGENPISLGDKRLVMIADSYWGNLANSIRCTWTNMAMCPSTILEQHWIFYLTYCQRSPSKRFS